MNKTNHENWEREVSRIACHSIAKSVLSLDVSEVLISDELNQRVEDFLAETRETVRRRHHRRRITVILVAAVLLILTACASIPAIREKLYEIVFSKYNKYYTFYAVPNENGDAQLGTSADYPPSFENKELSYIPEGFELVESKDGSFYAFYTYMHRDIDTYIRFDQYWAGYLKVDLSSSNIRIREIMVNGFVGTHVTWEGGITQVILWNDGIYDYEVYADLPYEEVLKIAESVG